MNPQAHHGWPPMVNRIGQTDKGAMAIPKRMGLIKEVIYHQLPARRALGAEQLIRRERRYCRIDPVVVASPEVRTRSLLRRSVGLSLSPTSHLRGSQERVVRC